MRPLIGAADGDAFTAGMFGLAVERATSNLAQSGTLDLFTVSGGRVAVFLIVGQVTTVVQAQADNTKLIAHPTSGTDVDLCATADITGLEVGGLLVPALNAFGTALSKTLAGAAPFTYGGAIVAPGTIRLSCSASNTGQAKWTLFYSPFDTGAAVAAA